MVLRTITVGGYLLHLNIAKYNMISDSTTEAEHELLEKLAKDMKLVQMLLTKLNLVESHNRVFEDDAGAMFLSIKCQVSKITKNKDLEHHSIIEFTEDKNVCNQGKTLKIESKHSILDIRHQNKEF